MAAETMTLAEFARHIQRSKAYVSKLRKAGRLVLTPNSGRVRVPESLALIEQTADPSKAGVRRRWDAYHGVGEFDDEAERAELEAGEQYTAARTRRERALADRAEMEAAELASRLVDAEELARAGKLADGAARGVLTAWPATVHKRLAGMVDAGAVEAFLASEARELLLAFGRRVQELAQEIDRQAGRGRH